MESKPIDIQKFEKQEEIQTDEQKDTYILREKDTKDLYFAKATHDEVTKYMPISSITIDQEANILSKLDHPSIIQYVGFSPIDLEGKNKHVIITKYCKNGSLYSILQEKKIKLTDTQKLKILYGIASGLLYLKSKRIIFRNLNTRNILLDDKLFPKISGFQLSKQYDSTPYMIADIEGEPIYIAPEIWESWKYSEASDVYAFSIIAYQLYSDQIPFQNLNSKEISEKVKEKQRPNIDSINASEAYKNLIQICWSQDPEKRPSFDQIVNLLKTDEGFITSSIDKKEYFQYVQYIEDSEYIKQHPIEKGRDINCEEEFIVDVDRISFEKVKFNIQSTQIKIKIAIRTTCHEFIEIVKNKFNLTNVSFYLTFNDRMNEVNVLDDDNPIYSLNTHNFIVHYGEIIQSTKTYIESLANARIINFGEDFSLQTNSTKANYNVVFPPDHEGWFDVPFNITNNSPASSTDKALITLKMNEKEISFLQKGNTLLHQYHQGDEWITDDEPVFLSYPDCKRAVFLLNHCSEHRITSIDTSISNLIPEKNKDNNYSRDWEGMCRHVFYEKGGKDYYVPVDYNSIGIKVKSFDENTCVAFHGTKARFVGGIIEKDFILPSKREGVLKGHIPLNRKVFGIENFADAIFVSPSIKYSSMYGNQGIVTYGKDCAYVESGQIENDQIRILMLQVRVKPNSFSIHRNTTDYQFKDPHYDDDQLEWRVGKPEDMFPYRLLFRHLSLDDYKPELHSYGKNFPYSTTKNSKIVFVPPNMETGKSTIGIGYRIGSILSEKKQLNSNEFIELVDSSSKFIFEIKHSPEFKEIHDTIKYARKIDMSKLMIRVYIPSSVTSIEDESFKYCNLLTRIVIPQSVKSIGKYAFSECTSLTQIILPSSITSIRKSLFYQCSSLAQIEIPSSVTSIEDDAFNGCSSLKQITIPPSVTSIGNTVFIQCSSLRQISIPSSVTSIGKGIFKFVPISVVTGSIQKIYDGMFAGCISTKIEIPSSVTSIGDESFCSSIVQFTIPSSVKRIGKFAFSGCRNLEHITIPTSVTFIDDYAFYACDKLQVTFSNPSSLKSIQFLTFSLCGLKQITIPSSVKKLGSDCFQDCKSLTQVTFQSPSSLTSIDRSAFEGCVSLKEIVIPSSVTSIGEYAFNNCSSLRQVSIPSSLVSIEKGTFFCCSSLTQFTIPYSVKFIKEKAFKLCTSLAQITIPSSVISIGSDAFYKCSSLNKESIPSRFSLYSIGLIE